MSDDDDEVLITEIYEATKRTDLLGALIIGVGITLMAAGIFYLVMEVAR